MIALWAFMFENMFFPTGQQEYGILEIASWFRGLPYAEPELISFAAGQLGRPVDDIAVESFAMPIAPWVYPVWAIAICVALLVFARIMVGWRWTATAVVGGLRAVPLPDLAAADVHHLPAERRAVLAAAGRPGGRRGVPAASCTRTCGRWSARSR